jgi:hypothetical protein
MEITTEAFRRWPTALDGPEVPKIVERLGRSGKPRQCWTLEFFDGTRYICSVDGKLAVTHRSRSIGVVCQCAHRYILINSSRRTFEMPPLTFNISDMPAICVA